FGFTTALISSSVVHNGNDALFVGGYGLNTNQTGFILRNSLIYGSIGAAIRLAQEGAAHVDQCQILNNIIYGNAAGIVVTVSFYDVIQSNIFYGNGLGNQSSSSIDLDTSDNDTILGNLVYSAGGYGIIGGGYSRVVANTMHDNGVGLYWQGG